jgi:hypothetical protein
MQRAKLLAAIAGALLIVAVGAIPASAWFKSTTTQGTFKATTAGTLTGLGGGMIICSKTVGAWHIESSGKLAGRGVKEQFLTKEGPHLGLTISKWEACQAGGVLPVTVSPCILQVEQPLKGGLTGTGSVATPCKVVIAAIECEFEVPALAPNEFLKATSFTKSGANVSIKSTIEGLTTIVANSKVTPCKTGGVVASSENKFTGVTLAESVELV